LAVPVTVAPLSVIMAIMAITAIAVKKLNLKNLFMILEINWLLK
jgi:hypothetical protein